MNKYILRLIFVLVWVTGTMALYGQGVEIRGTITNSDEGAPLVGATVVLMQPGTGAVLGGAYSDEAGKFTLTAADEKFYIEIRYLGMEDKQIRSFEIKDGKVDLGKIALDDGGTGLDVVEIRAEKSQTVFKLDKRVFNVGQDLTSTGASALEVLNNVPSVNVNIEGQISLRGNAGVQVLINGKPSVLASDEGNALGTITADMIDRVEVITNPSAKYEAEGTAGIINIVLKKEERKGTNGSISLNTGWPHNHSLGFSVNRRTEKFNLFSQFGVGYRSLPRYQEASNTDFNQGTSIISDGIEFRNETFFNITLGTDYHIDDYNVLTLSGNFAYEIEDQPSETDFILLDSSGSILEDWTRTETTEATNPKWQYDLQYKREFRDNEDHTLLLSAQGNSFAKDQSSGFVNLFEGNTPTTFQETATSFGETRYTFKGDYTKPFSKHWKLEAGSQYNLQDVSNDFTVRNLVDGEWVEDAGLTNLFEFEQNVLGVYSTGAYERGRWGAKLGLRLENTDVRTLLVNTQEENIQNYTNLFPSGATSFKITEVLSVQGGYSRRVFRPRLWDLNPFFNIRNNFSIRAGNPALQPEFTDSYELNTIYLLKKGSVNLGIFHLYTTEVVERVATVTENVNITMPMNIGTRQSTGIEFNYKYTPVKALTLSGDVNWQSFDRQGELEGRSFDFTGSQWSTKLTAKVKLPANFDVEGTGNYRSAFRTVQGTQAEIATLDLGLRKKLAKGRAVINFSVRDVFASGIRETMVVQPTFESTSSSLRGRFLTLGFSYGFGKGEAMQYSGRRR